MARLSTYGITRSSARRRWVVIAIWIVALLIAGYLSATYLSDALTTDFESQSNQDSVVGLDLLEERMGYDDPERETIVVDSTTTIRRRSGLCRGRQQDRGRPARLDRVSSIRTASSTTTSSSTPAIRTMPIWPRSSSRKTGCRSSSR